MYTKSAAELIPRVDREWLIGAFKKKLDAACDMF